MYHQWHKKRLMLCSQLSLLVTMCLVVLPGSIVYARDNQMTNEMKLQVHNECERLSLLYFDYIDHGQDLNVVDLFTDDAVLKVSPDVGEWRGKDSFRQAFQEQLQLHKNGHLHLHLQDNFMLTSISTTEAAGKAYLTVYRAFGKPGQGEPGRQVAVLGGPDIVAETRWKFAKTEEGWRIAAYEIIYVFIKFPTIPSLYLTPDQFNEYQRQNYSRHLKSVTSEK